MTRDAFVRALRFLQYSRLASVGAYAATCLLGLLYVLLLGVLGLYADLLVHRGQVVPLAGDAEQSFQVWLEDEAQLSESDRLEVRDRVRTGDGVGLLSLAWRSKQAGRWYEPVFTSVAAHLSWSRNNHTYLSLLMLAGLGTLLVRGGLNILLHQMASGAVVEASVRLRRAVYHQTFRLGTLAFRELGSTEAVGIFTRYIESVQEGLYIWLTVVFREPIKLFLLIIFAAGVEWGATGGPPLLSLACVLFAAVVWLLGGQMAAYFRRRSRLNVRRAAEQLALLQESLRLMRLVKCYLMELFNQARVERQLAEYSRLLLQRYRGGATYRQVLVFLAGLSATVLMFVIGWRVVEGGIGLAAVLTIAAALTSLFYPAWNWLNQLKVLRRARQSAVALFEFLDRKGEVGQVVGAEFLPPMSKRLDFLHVSLDEPGTGRPLLEEVTFQIAAGERVALVGQADLEKHALVYLIPRFLDPKQGEIRIDGKDLRWVTLESLRVQVALVLQHDLVFNDTAANNIGCGDPGYSLPQIIEAAKAAHAHHFIKELPQGYDTPIGELGHHLSVTEQFRIGLARAILRDPAIVIIEEPYQSIDDDTKAMLDDTYSRFLPGRTVIFLPHRLSTTRSCHRVFLINQGRLEAVGEHRELLSRSELYRHLQYMEFNVFAEPPVST